MSASGLSIINAQTFFYAFNSLKNEKASVYSLVRKTYRWIQQQLMSVTNHFLNSVGLMPFNKKSPRLKACERILSKTTSEPKQSIASFFPQNKINMKAYSKKVFDN